MKKLFKEINILILLIFLLNFAVLSINSVITSKISNIQLALFAVLIVVIWISFVTDFIFSLIFSSLIILLYASFLFFKIYSNSIVGIEQLSYYIWFFVLPLAAFIGGTLKKKLIEIEEEIKKMEIQKKELALNDDLTLFKSKNTFIQNLNKVLEIYNRRKIKFSTIMIKIQDFDILKSSLSTLQMKEFYLFLSKIIDKLTRFEEDKYFLGDGSFTIILQHADEKELEGAMQRLKEHLKDELNQGDPILKLKKIPFKISGFVVSESIGNALDIINQLDKGLEYDV